MSITRQLVARTLAFVMVGLETIMMIMISPAMALYPLIDTSSGVIYLPAFVSASIGVLFLYTFNLYFAEGFINVIYVIIEEKRVEKEAIQE